MTTAAGGDTGMSGAILALVARLYTGATYARDADAGRVYGRPARAVAARRAEVGVSHEELAGLLQRALLFGPTADVRTGRGA